MSDNLKRILILLEHLSSAKDDGMQVAHLVEETGLAAGVLNHPATAVAWLANKIAPNGLALEAGQIVLAGSFIRPIETRKGDTIQADYGPYGSVSCYFA